MGGIAGFLERVIGGKSSDIGGPLTNLTSQGGAQYAYGQDLTRQGIGGLNAGIADDQATIAGGGLSPALRQQFAIARGGLQDNATRMQRAFRARMQQRALASGGVMPAAAQNEYDLENEQASNESLFGATNELNMTEANTALENTNRLSDRIMAARNSILGAGSDQSKMGIGAQMGSLGLRYQRNKAISDAIMSYFGGGKGGGGGLSSMG